MKTCPICKKSFADELNFCLEDGGLLVESERYESERTIAFSEHPTWMRSQQTQLAKQVVTNPSPSIRQTSFNQPTRKTAVLILLGIGSLMVSIVFGVYLLSHYAFKGDLGHPDKYRRPPPTLTPTITPTVTPTPTPENNIKVEILGKGKNGRGTKFLTGKATNISNKIVELWSIELNFYKGDVKIRDSYADLKLKILKPNQTIPIWINIYDTDYTSFKVKEPIYTKPVRKTEAQLFPSLEFSETEMKAKSGFYAVSGIVENSNDEKISPEIFVIFYDEKSEIVGIESKSVSNLEKGVKNKFEVREYETDMFGKPKTFEIIAISYP